MRQRTRPDRESVRTFFAARAARWETRFPDDGPAYTAAVAELTLAIGDSALDAGCGTGRALPPLRAAVGAEGTVVGVDLTPEMLTVASDRAAHGALVEAGVSRLPLHDGTFDAVLAAGLLSHLGSPEDDLRELARVARPGARLALFHPVGRAALAARKGHRLDGDDLRAEHRLRPLLAAAGWRLRSYADEDDRYLALAVRDG